VASNSLGNPKLHCAWHVLIIYIGYCSCYTISLEICLQQRLPICYRTCSFGINRLPVEVFVLTAYIHSTLQLIIM